MKLGHFEEELHPRLLDDSRLLAESKIDMQISLFVGFWLQKKASQSPSFSR